MMLYTYIIYTSSKINKARILYDIESTRFFEFEYIRLSLRPPPLSLSFQRNGNTQKKWCNRDFRKGGYKKVNIVLHVTSYYRQRDLKYKL